MKIDLKIDSDAGCRMDRISVSFCDRFGTRLVNADTIALGRSVYLRRGTNHVGFDIASLHLNPGVYHVGLWMSNHGRVVDCLPEALQLEVVDVPGRNLRGPRPEGDGLVTCDFELSDFDEIKGDVTADSVGIGRE